MVTVSIHNNIETIKVIVQDEENDMHGDFVICEYDSNRFQQKPLFELHEIGNVILIERQKRSNTFFKLQRVCTSWQLLSRMTVIICTMVI